MGLGPYFVWMPSQFISNRNVSKLVLRCLGITKWYPPSPPPSSSSPHMALLLYEQGLSHRSSSLSSAVLWLRRLNQSKNRPSGFQVKPPRGSHLPWISRRSKSQAKILNSMIYHEVKQEIFLEILYQKPLDNRKNWSRNSHNKLTAFYLGVHSV